MAFPQIKTPLPLTVRKRQRRKNSSAVPLLLPVQSPAPQCASNNARPVITGACRSRLLGHRCCPFSRKARRGSSHGRPALPCTIRQLSAAFFPGTLSRHSRIFHCPAVYSSARAKSRDGPVGFFIWFASGMKAVQARAAILSYSFFWLSVRVGSTPPIMASANSCVSTSTYSMPFSCSSL